MFASAAIFWIHHWKVTLTAAFIFIELIDDKVNEMDHIPQLAALIGINGSGGGSSRMTMSFRTSVPVHEKPVRRSLMVLFQVKNVTFVLPIRNNYRRHKPAVSGRIVFNIIFYHGVQVTCRCRFPERLWGSGNCLAAFTRLSRNISSYRLLREFVRLFVWSVLGTS